MNDAGANKTNVVNSAYVKAGIYPSNNMNQIGRFQNNIDSGEGISITRNPVGGIRIQQEENLTPFKIYNPISTTDWTNVASTIQIFEGYWVRNGFRFHHSSEVANFTKTMLPAGGTAIIFLGLDNSIIPTQANLYATTESNFYDFVSHGDITNRYTKIGQITLDENGVITDIVQSVSSDIDDIAEISPFKIHDLHNVSNVASSDRITLRIFNGMWWDQANSRSVTLSEDIGEHYKTITLTNTSSTIYGIVLNYDPDNVTLTVAAESIFTAVNDVEISPNKRLVGMIYTQSYEGGLRIGGLSQEIYGDVYQSNGGGGTNTMPVVRAQYDVITSLDGSTWTSDVVRFHN